jgi:hypothetical protein
LKKRRADCKRTSGFSLPRFAPAKRSAPIISRQQPRDLSLPSTRSVSRRLDVLNLLLHLFLGHLVGLRQPRLPDQRPTGPTLNLLWAIAGREFAFLRRRRYCPFAQRPLNHRHSSQQQSRLSPRTLGATPKQNDGWPSFSTEPPGSTEAPQSASVLHPLILPAAPSRIQLAN